jgi:hypothetical protein
MEPPESLLLALSHTPDATESSRTCCKLLRLATVQQPREFSKRSASYLRPPTLAGRRIWPLARGRLLQCSHACKIVRMRDWWRTWWRLVVGAVVLVAAIQGVYAGLVFLVWSDMSTRGQFGDLFGAVTAFFTGLAFGGVLYTLHLQRKELEAARDVQQEAIQALKDQVEALKESAAGLTEQVKETRADRETMVNMDKQRNAMEFNFEVQ